MKLVGERRALAACVMAFYFLVYGAFAYSRIQPDFTPAFVAIAGVYGLAFWALVAGYFWARWYAVGVGLYGVITAAVAMWQLGAEPVVLFVGATHLAATLALWGSAMAGPYDGQKAWREKFHMDDNAVQRLGRSVIRAGVSLPFVLLYALAPKPGSEMLAALAALALTGLGIRGLVRMKTWGVMAIGAAGALLVVLAGFDMISHESVTHVLRPALAGGLLLSATVPFAAPMARWVAAR
jgi:hypothetical protein